MMSEHVHVFDYIDSDGDSQHIEIKQRTCKCACECYPDQITFIDWATDDPITVDVPQQLGIIMIDLLNNNTGDDLCGLKRK